MVTARVARRVYSDTARQTQEALLPVLGIVGEQRVVALTASDAALKAVGAEDVRLNQTLALAKSAQQAADKEGARLKRVRLRLRQKRETTRATLHAADQAGRHTRQSQWQRCS